MKQIVFITALLLGALTTSSLSAQIIIMDGSHTRADTVDYARVMVQYEANILIDTLHHDKESKETMILEIGKNVSKFYSYTKFLCDSILQADIANRVSREVMNQHVRQYGRSIINETTFKGYPANQTTTLDEIAGMTRMRCEEPEERPQWILGTDTATILSYSCHKAECQFKGRKWTVWFATEIPISEGPWKLYGLPGLILKATDSQGNYSFSCTGVEQCHTKKPILFHGKGYELINRKAYNKIHERYSSDPVGFITSANPNVKITMHDEHGNPAQGPHHLPYSPLELEDK